MGAVLSEAQERELLAYMAKHPEWSVQTCLRSFAKERGLGCRAVEHHWYQVMRKRGVTRPVVVDAARPEQPGPAYGPERPAPAEVVAEALFEKARGAAVPGRLTSADLEEIGRRFGWNFARVFGLWGSMHANGRVSAPAGLKAELEAARARIAELEGKLAGVERILEAMRQLTRDLPALIG